MADSLSLLVQQNVEGRTTAAHLNSNPEASKAGKLPAKRLRVPNPVHCTAPPAKAGTAVSSWALSKLLFGGLHAALNIVSGLSSSGACAAHDSTSADHGYSHLRGVAQRGDAQP